MTPDPLLALREADPAPRPAPYDPAHAARLLDRAVAAGPARRSGRPREHRRSLVVAVVVVVALLTTAGVYAVLRQSPPTALGLLCAAGTSQEEFERRGRELVDLAQTTGGDPVADCARQYQSREGAVPPLRAWSSGGNHIHVVPADWPVPQDWEPLEEGFAVDPVRLELAQRLSDLVEGPEARCRSADEVEALVRSDLADLGLRGWTVDRLEQAARADGDRWCAVALPDLGGAERVSVQGVEGPDEQARAAVAAEPANRVVASLRRDVAGACVPLRRARDLVSGALRSAGLDPRRDAVVTVVDDPDASCTRVDVLPSGTFDIVLRGPDG